MPCGPNNNGDATTIEVIMVKNGHDPLQLGSACLGHAHGSNLCDPFCLIVGFVILFCVFGVFGLEVKNILDEL